MTPADIARLEPFLTPDELAELNALLAADIEEVPWTPLPGPQTMAYNSEADVIGFGGSAGGGKTDLAVGKALNQHYEVLMLRREATQLKGILRRFEQIIGDRDGYNGQEKIWRNAGPRDVTVEFGSCPNLGDETKHQGNPHDLLVFDEAANFLEQQVNFLLGWNRSTREGVHSQALMTFNPPTSQEGRWIVDFFAPWLDRKHPLYPTAPGELRYCVTVPQENETVRYEWVPDQRPCVIAGGQIVYDFDPAQYAPEDIVIPQSRTFIPSRISDNPFLAQSGYLRQLQAMPEPLRSQLLYGDFQAGMTDDPWQVIPTAWVAAAQARWKPLSPKGEQMSQGVDVARGGKDNTVIADRYAPPDGAGPWIDKLHLYAGEETPDGPKVAGLTIAHRRDDAPVHIDVIGVGASPYDTLNSMAVHVLGINVAEAARGTDKSGRLTFFNLRSELWWRMREALDPAHDKGLALPPDPELAKELCAPKWELSGLKIRVESREDIVKRTGRSPDRATAVVLAMIDTPKRLPFKQRKDPARRREHDPYAPLAT
jgi:hypothetical protein